MNVLLDSFKVSMDKSIVVIVALVHIPPLEVRSVLIVKPVVNKPIWDKVNVIAVSKASTKAVPVSITAQNVL